MRNRLGGPESVETHFNADNALVRASRPAEALTRHEEVLEFRPDFAPAQAMLARLRPHGENRPPVRVNRNSSDTDGASARFRGIALDKMSTNS